MNIDMIMIILSFTCMAVCIAAVVNVIIFLRGEKDNENKTDSNKKTD